MSSEKIETANEAEEEEDNIEGYDDDDEPYQIQEVNLDQKLEQAMESANIDARMNTLPDPLPAQLKSRNTGSSNTGPKGVKADFEQAKRNLENINLRKKIQFEMELEKMINGVVDLSTIEQKEQKEQKKEVKKNKEEEEEEEEGDEEDDLAFQQYKMQRIRSIQNSLPVYGEFDRVNLQQLAIFLKQENEFVYLVVHLYQNHLASCTRTNIALESIAKKFKHVHFVRIRSHEAIPKYSDYGLPTLLVYRRGKLEHSFIRLTDLIGKKINEVSLAKFLFSHKILREPIDEGITTQQKKKEEAEAETKTEKTTTKKEKSNYITKKNRDDE